MQPPGAASPHRPRSKHHACSAQERGPICASASYLGRELPWPHHPMPVPDTFGVQPGTPWGRSRVPPHRLPAPSSSLCRLPPAASVLVLPRSQIAGSAYPRDTPGTLLPRHGGHAPASHAGEEHRPGHAGPHQQGCSLTFPVMLAPFRSSTTSLGRAGTGHHASAPAYTVNSRYDSNNFTCMIDFFLPGFVLDSPQYDKSTENWPPAVLLVTQFRDIKGISATNYVSREVCTGGGGW